MKEIELIEALTDQEIEAIALSILQGFGDIALDNDMCLRVDTSTVEDYIKIELKDGTVVGLLDGNVDNLHSKVINKLKSFLKPIIEHKLKTGNYDLEVFANSYKVRLVNILGELYAEIQSLEYNSEEPVYIKVDVPSR